MRVISFDCGRVNLAWCVYDSDEDRIIDWQVKDVRQPENQSLKEHLMRRLDEWGFADITKCGLNAVDVVIEKQPFRNAICKAIESTLEDYFILRGKIDVSRDEGIGNICVFNAKHKLAGQKIKKGKKAYQERKQRSIDLAKELCCVKKSDWYKYLNKLKKQDDACDALLQARAYCEHQEACHTFPHSKSVIARKPKDPNNLTPAGCKYMLKQMLYPRLRKQRAGALERLPDAVANQSVLSSTISRCYGTLDKALQDLKLV